MSSGFRNVTLNKLFLICKNKDADQLCCYHAVDQRLHFHYEDCTNAVLPNSEISSL